MSEDADIFDMDQPRPTASHRLSAPEPAEQAKDAPTASKIGFRPIHMLLIMAFATVVWLVWPFIASTPSADAPHPRQRQLDASATAASVAEMQPAEPTNVPPSSAPRQNLTLTPVEVELQSKLAQMEGVIANLEASISQLSAAKPTVPKGLQRPKPTARPLVVDPAILSGLTINTMYANQAWLTKGDQTYVVQAGDALDGVRIIRIDLNSREVVTDQGKIR